MYKVEFERIKENDLGNVIDHNSHYWYFDNFVDALKQVMDTVELHPANLNKNFIIYMWCDDEILFSVDTYSGVWS